MEPSNFINRDEITELFWENDHENKPLNKDQSSAPHLAIQYLETHPNAFTKTPKETHKLIGIIEKTDLSKTEMEESDWKALSIMAKKHPELFTKFNEIAPTTTVSVNGIKRSLSKNHLFMKSDVFRMMLSSGSKEAHVNRIDIAGNYSKECSDAFLDYLHHGNIDITDDTAFELLGLANTYNVDDLREKAVNYLTSQLSQDTLITLLDGALKSNTPKLAQECLLFAMNDEESISFTLSEEEKLEHADAAKFLENLRAIKDHVYSDTQDRVFLKLVSLDKCDPLLKALDEINEHVDIGIDLSNFKNLDNNQLENIVSKSNNLKGLIVKSDKITKIDNEQKLNYLNCEGCTGLTSLTAPNATSLNCDGCTSLTSITAPNATTLSCEGCTSLTSLTAPNATWIYCTRCTGLTSLTAPNATSLNCDGCTSLTSITAPNATTLSCEGCTSLTSLTAPNATWIYCTRCTALTSLIAPNARKLHCAYCTALTSLTAPNARKLDCAYCTALTSLTAPNARKLDCAYCTALTSLTAPNATTLNCGSCTGLTSLTALKATTIFCSGCTSLTRDNIDVPESCMIMRI